MHVWVLGLGGAAPLTACHLLPYSGMGTCVSGSTARPSTSRTTCQSRRSPPAPLPQCPAPLQLFPHPSRPDLQPPTQVGLLHALCLLPSGRPVGNPWHWIGRSPCPGFGALAEPWKILPKGQSSLLTGSHPVAWVSASGQGSAGLPLSGAWPLSTGEVS